MNTDISKLTDIELAEIYGQCFQRLNVEQGNIMAISKEIERRKQVVKPIDEAKHE